MATINVGEDDFMAAAMGARYAQDRGDPEQAKALDKLARKINASLAASGTRELRWMSAGERKPLTWEDVPSVLDPAGE